MHTQVNLQHVQSGLYVSLSSARAKQDGALKLKLAPDSTHSGFIVLPGYKSSSLGDVVQYGHGLTFRNDVLKNFIHVAPPLPYAEQCTAKGLLLPWWDVAGRINHHHPYVSL